ncbi:MAG: Hsp70 family protein [Alphaproteobacteria bacterium]|nr:Hsp70 family protein [Beijerinckiaceae bacterium]NBQ39487.1 Hsp70 family protein [Alphaproteobacteria bacterium]
MHQLPSGSDGDPASACLGLDFGTTNSVAAMIGAGGRIETAQFIHDGVADSVCRSALSFFKSDNETQVEIGPWAVDRYLADPMDCRFLQSFKTFAASGSFRSTAIYGRPWRYEDLMASFVEGLLSKCQPLPPTSSNRLVIGRPVAYAGHAPDATLAQSRYETALARCGFDDVHFVYEPVAAAFYFAQRLEKDATVLVADFGGGTSDFSIVRFSFSKDGIRGIPLSRTGVGLAGDRFDYRIIDHVVSPRLGKGSQYKSFGKMLDIPIHYFANFAAWHQLAIMKAGPTIRELRQLANASDNPEPLEMLITIIENDLGYPLYKAISEAKLALSHHAEAAFSFHSDGISIDATIEREEFERWIAPDLDRIDLAVDQALLDAGLTPADIDKVFLTGGSSFVPAVQERFKRFGEERLETGDQLLSIASGLALIGQESNIERWTVREV